MRPQQLDRPLLVILLGLLGALTLGLAIGPQEPQPAEDDPETPLLVTSTLGATSALLFVVDPRTRTLAAYEAFPGEEGGLRLLGARKIEHDLHLTRYRDASEYSFAELEERLLAQPGEEGEDSRSIDDRRR